MIAIHDKHNSVKTQKTKWRWKTNKSFSFVGSCRCHLFCYFSNSFVVIVRCIYAGRATNTIRIRPHETREIVDLQNIEPSSNYTHLHIRNDQTKQIKFDLVLNSVTQTSCYVFAQYLITNLYHYVSKICKVRCFCHSKQLRKQITLITTINSTR